MQVTKRLEFGNDSYERSLTNVVRAAGKKLRVIFIYDLSPMQGHSPERNLIVIVIKNL